MQGRLRRRLAASCEAMAARDRAVAMIAHEIREPINAVLGMARLMRETPLDEEQGELADAIIESAQTLATLINDTLDLSTLDAGKLAIVPIVFDPRALLERLRRQLQIRAEPRGIAFHLVVAQALPARLRGDPGRIFQILLNLAGNALKFTQEGEVRLEVTMRARPENPLRLRFTVSDTGPGVDPEVRARLFQPFAQADHSVSRLYGGSGLGLMIARRLAQAMGGSLDLDHTATSGARFVLELPLGEVDAASHGSDAGASLAGGSVLIAGTQERARDTLADLARLWGMDVAVAQNPRDVLSRLDDAADRGRPFDIVTLDGDLEGLPPDALADRLRNHPRHKAVRLVLLVSSGLRGDAARARDAGFDAYLPRPPEPELFAACLRRLRAGERGDGLITAHSIEEQRGPPLDILVVDDNPLNLRLATILLERAGHRVTAVGDGGSAVDLVRTHPFDLVLMDMQMPGVDGLEATRLIRALKDPARAAIPIVAVTANAMQGDDRRCLDAGMNGYVTKPIDGARLIEVVDHHGRADG